MTQNTGIYPNYSGNRELADTLCRKIELYWAKRGQDWVRCSIEEDAMPDNQRERGSHRLYSVRSNMKTIPREPTKIIKWHVK